MHLQPLYSKNEFFYVEEMPVSEFLFEHGICLPSGCNLNEEDQAKISKAIIKYLKKMKIYKSKVEKTKFCI